MIQRRWAPLVRSGTLAIYKSIFGLSAVMRLTPCYTDWRHRTEILAVN